MAIQEQNYGEYYAFQPTKYLYDWARRTGNMGNLANYFVEDRVDGSTGRVIFFIRDIADLPSTPSIDPAEPIAINLSVNDPTVTAEYKTDL